MVSRKNDMENVGVIEREEREVVQHYLAIEKIEEYNAFILSEELIKNVHRILMDKMLDDEGLEVNAGQYRIDRMSARTTTFIPPEFVPETMIQLVADFNELSEKKLHPFATWLMAEFLTIHPFNDGNGRMSRLLFNWVLRKHHGLPFYVSVT